MTGKNKMKNGLIYSARIGDLERVKECIEKVDLAQTDEIKQFLIGVMAMGIK